MAIESIHLISKEAIDSFITLKGLVNDNVEAFEKLIAMGVQLNNNLGKANTFQQINKGSEELNKNEKDLLNQIKSLQQANDRLNKLYEEQGKKLDVLTAKKPKNDSASVSKTAKAQKELNDLYSAEARELAVIIEQKKLVNAGNRLTAKETLGLVDAYARLEQEYKAAAREAQNLAIQFGASSKEALEASARALELDKRLKDADAAVGRFNRNVGNYSGALKVLEKALADAQKKQDAYRASGQQNVVVLEQLQKEEQLLTQLLNSQISGFATANAEIKANTVALQQMAAAGLEGTEAYNALFKATSELKDETADLKTALSNAAPDDVAFNAAADAARGLIGLYGLATSATAAFGLKNEAFEETLVKLQAAETALQSIEAVRNLFKKESAFQQGILLAQQKIIIAQTYLESAAQSKNIIVRYAAIAAQKALNVVMSLAGGPMLAIIALLALLVISLTSFSSATIKTARDFEKLNSEFEGFENLLNDRIDIIKRTGDLTVAELEKNFANEQAIRNARRKALVEESGEIKRFLVENAAAYREAFDTSIALTQRERAGEELSKQDKKRLSDAITFVDKYINTRKRSDDLETQLEIDRLNSQKAAIEETAKIRQSDIDNLIKINAERKAVYDKDADDQRKNFDDRIEAQKRANDIEIQLINDRAKRDRVVPGLSPSEIKSIETSRITAITAARREGDAKLEALNRERATRERQAQYEIARITVELQGEAALEIANNQDKNLEDRLFAQYEYFKTQEALITGAKNNELNNATLTATERLAIEEKANADILRAKIQFLKDTNAISLQALEDQNADSVSNQNRANSEALTALNNRFNEGLISLRTYNKERAKIEVEFNNASLQLQIDNLKKVAAEYATQGKDITQIQEQIADKEMQLSELTTQKRLQDLEKVKAAQQQLGEEIFELFSTLIVAGYEKEKNAIQEQIDLNEEKKERDISIAQQTITDKQKQADEVALIEARAQANREALERKQRQLDVQKAKFDKQQTIAKIILDTARAVIAALTSTPPNVPLSIYVGAIGAVSLARAIATSIPQYRHGTDSAKGGFAWLGDGYTREWGVTPAGQIFSTDNKPTLTYTPAGTKIYANDQKAMEAGIFADMQHIPALTSTETHYKYMTEKLGGKLDTIAYEVRRGNRIRSGRNRAGRQTIISHEGSQKNYLDKSLK